MQHIFKLVAVFVVWREAVIAQTVMVLADDIFVCGADDYESAIK